MPGFFDILKEPPVPYPGAEKYPLFNRISIETISYCNRRCPFCPVAWADRGHTAMAPALYDKLVAELAALKFDGVAQLFFLTEPFLDRTLKAKARALREACPDVSIYISSNGDVLDKLWQTRGPAHALKLLEEHYEAGINVVNINSYDPGPEQLERYLALELAAREQLHARHTEHKYRHHNPRQRYLCITDMRFGDRDKSEERVKGTDIFYIRNAKDRADLAARQETVPQLHCMRTQRHLVVLFDGKVPICCAIDPNDPATLVADANVSTLEDIWNSEVFFKYRWFTQQGKRVLPHCRTCTHKMAFPHVVRKVQPDEVHALRWIERVDEVL